MLHSVGQDERRTPCPTKRSSHWSPASVCCCGSTMMILDPMQTLRLIIGNLWNFAGSTCGGKAWSGIDRCHVMTWERFSLKICTIGSWMNVRKIHRRGIISRSCTPSSTCGRESSLETSLPSETSCNNLAVGKHGTKSRPGKPSCARR